MSLPKPFDLHEYARRLIAPLAPPYAGQHVGGNNGDRAGRLAWEAAVVAALAPLTRADVDAIADLTCLYYSGLSVAAAVKRIAADSKHEPSED